MDTDSSPFSENAGLHDILSLVFAWLNYTDLYAAAATCKTWHRYATPRRDGTKFSMRSLDIVCSPARLQWAKNWDYLPAIGPIRDRLCSTAASNGNLASLQWLRANGYPWGTNVCFVAARDGNLKMLQWCHENGAPWDTWVCNAAARGGDQKMLQWCHANKAPWSEWACTNAAEGGHLEVLQWLRANGCPWNKDVCTRAAESGHLRILQWAFSVRAPYDYLLCLGQAAAHGQLEVLQWLCGIGFQLNGWICEVAAKNGHFEVLRWARANGCPWDKNTCAQKAKSPAIAEWICAQPD